MARIKTYQGSGPNPNVPFAGDVPLPQFIGQEEQAFSRLAGTIEKGALQYMEIRRKQTDTANQASADVARLEFEDAIQNDDKLYKPDGTLDTAYYKDKLNSFYDNLRPNMSKDAYVQWSSRQSVMDARKMSSMQSENLKRTREADKFTSTESLQLLLSNSTTGSFEDMQDAVIKGKSIIDNGLDSGIYTPQEALRLETEMPQKAAKSYIDTLTNKNTDNVDEINSSFAQAESFVEADPYGVYSRDAGLKESVLADLRSKKLDQTKRAQNRAIEKGNREEALLRENQNRKYRSYQKKLYDHYSSENPNPDDLDAILGDILSDSETNGLTRAQAMELANTRQRSLELMDEMNTEMAVNAGSPEEAQVYIDRISNPNKQRNAFQAISGIPFEYRSTLKDVMSYDKSQSNAIAKKFSESLIKFQEYTQSNPDYGYDSSDLQILFLQRYASRYSDMYHKRYLPYSQKLDAKLKLQGSSMTEEDYLKRLSSALNF